MREKRKLKIIGLKNWEYLIAIKVPKVDKLRDFIMEYLEALGVEEGKVWDYDMVFSEILHGFFTVSSEKYSIDMYVEKDSVMIVTRFSKDGREELWKIIKQTFFLTDGNMKDIDIMVTA